MKNLLTMTLLFFVLTGPAQAAPPLAEAMQEVFQHLAGGIIHAKRTTQVTPMRNAKLAERKVVFMTAGENEKFTVLVSRDYKPSMTEMNIDVIQKLDPATQSKIEAIPDNHLLTGYYYPHSYNVELLDKSGRLAQHIVPNFSQVQSLGKKIIANIKNVEGVHMDTLGTELHFDLFNKNAALVFHPHDKNSVKLPGILAGSRKYPLGFVHDFNGTGRAAVYRLQVALPTNTTAEEVYRILEAIASSFE